MRRQIARERLESLVLKSADGDSWRARVSRGGSPIQEDLERLVGIAEQNLRLLDEDVDDWRAATAVAEGFQDKRVGKDGSEIEKVCLEA